MGAVRRQAVRRWLVVAAAAGVAVALPPAIGALPARGGPVPADQLRLRILGSAGQPYQGYAESSGRLAVPDLPQLSDVTALLNSTMRLRTWYAGPDQWRVDQIGVNGAERDVYRVGHGVEYVWDYGANVLTQVLGDPPLRLPRSADLVPPQLARRLLALAPGDPVGPLPARRVAGVDAAGLRLTPADPETTIGAVDVWADPVTGLAVQVEITGRGAAAPVLTTRFLDLAQRAPAPGVLRQRLAPGVAFESTESPDLVTAVGSVGFPVLPDELAGRARRPLPEGFGALGVYGSGLSAFVVLPLPRGLGRAALSGLGNAGGVPVTMSHGGTGVAFSTPLVSVLVVRYPDVRRTLLLAGLDRPALIRQAAADLDARLRAAP